jgi:hypothetical protein
MQANTTAATGIAMTAPPAASTTTSKYSPGVMTASAPGGSIPAWPIEGHPHD